MRKPFQLRCLPISLLLLSLSFTLGAVPKDSVIRANESPNAPSQPTSQPSEKQPKEPTPNSEIKQPTEPKENRDDRVYIKDVYPEYCRIYFHRRDWVSLFEYQTGMQRCFYGGDRWF